MVFGEHPAEDGTIEVEMRPSGRMLSCLICEHNRFYERKSLLNTRMASLFHVDWANSEAINFVCARCGYVHWFLP
jgi:hypothetical protein